MDPYFERILGLLTTAPTQRTFLKRQHSKASKAYEVFHRDSDFILAMESGNLLLADNDELPRQAAEATNAQNKPDEDANEEGDDNMPAGEMANGTCNLSFGRLSLIWIGMLGFIALCSAVGW